jgi:membrane protease YdiL (CAAX protease family)
LWSVFVPPVPVGLADFPVYYWQFVARAIGFVMTLKVIVEIEGYLLDRFLLRIKERKLSVAGFAFFFTFQSGLLPGKVDIARFECTQGFGFFCIGQDTTK